MRIRVVLVEDHQIVREGLRLLIQSQSDLEIAGEAGDGLTAYDVITNTLPDVAIIDISLPLLNGIELVRRLTDAGVDTRVLILTANEDQSYMRRILQKGALGYLLKRSAGDELITAIRAVAKGDRYVDSSVARALVNSELFQPKDRHAISDDSLSPREREVLRLVAMGYTNKEIAAKLDVSCKTIETHKARSMSKLSLFGRSDIVRLAVRLGWFSQ